MQKNRINFQIIPAYQAATKAKSLDAATTLGIEVTIPSVAEKCGLGNIDHHGAGCTQATPAACEKVFTDFFNWRFYSHGEERERGLELHKKIFNNCKAVVGTVLDADTLVSMCLIKIARKDLYYHNLFDMYELIGMIGAIDRLGASSARDQDENKYAEHSLIKAIMAVAGSRDMSLDQQIDEVVQILTVQEVSSAAKKAVEESDKLFNEAKIASKITKQLKKAKLVKSIAKKAIAMTLATPMVALVLIIACKMIITAGQVSRADNVSTVICCLLIGVLVMAGAAAIDAERQIQDLWDTPADS